MDPFDKAISTGRLSADDTSPLYAGLYMFMGQNRYGEDTFKHIDTREYLPQ